MNLYDIDPSVTRDGKIVTRACPVCSTGFKDKRLCPLCDGRARVPHDGEREIEVHYTDGGLFPQTRGWHWRRVGDEWSSERGPSDSKAEAVAAARDALESD